MSEKASSAVAQSHSADVRQLSESALRLGGGGRLSHGCNWVALPSGALCISSITPLALMVFCVCRPRIRQRRPVTQHLAFASHRVKVEGAALRSVHTVAAGREKPGAIYGRLSLNHSAPAFFGILVASLNDVTGRDPLGVAQVERSPDTIGEFIAPHEAALV
jgi:hypothetical protein